VGWVVEGVSLIVDGVTSGGSFRQRCTDDEHAEAFMAALERVCRLPIEWTVTVEDVWGVDALTGHRR
jgi:hypothetical protein